MNNPFIRFYWGHDKAMEARAQASAIKQWEHTRQQVRDQGLIKRWKHARQQVRQKTALLQLNYN